VIIHCESETSVTSIVIRLGTRTPATEFLGISESRNGG
jgi:hypothetical protein